jgi:hypothetical protein
MAYLEKGITFTLMHMCIKYKGGKGEKKKTDEV